jgi:hypothetical protein
MDPVRRVVLFSDELGVYLGNGKWSKRDGSQQGVHQLTAPTHGLEEDLTSEVAGAVMSTSKGDGDTIVVRPKMVWVKRQDLRATITDVKDAGLFWN